ncbi:MAG: PqqD family protein [Candidatus Woesearchaeota archaeon]
MWESILNKKPNKTKSVQIRKKMEDEEEKFLVFDFSNAVLYVLNNVAGRITELSNGERDLKTILEILKNEYDVPENVLISDIEKFLNELVEKKLVEI